MTKLLQKFLIILYFNVCSVGSLEADDEVLYHQSRTSITQVKPGKELDWIRIRRGEINFRKSSWSYLEFVAMAAGFYHDQDQYLFARDMEYAHDLAILLLKNFPDLQARFHLINVSRDSIDDPLLDQYLAQFNFSESAISRKTSILLWDTANWGSVMLRLKARLAKVADKMDARLLQSATSDIPMTRVFADFEKGRDGFGLANEKVPHATGKAVGYKKVGVKYDAVSAPGDKDSELSITSSDLRASLVTFSQRSDVKEKFMKRLNMWQKIRQYVDEKNKVALNTLITKLIVDEPEFGRAVASDLIELSERHPRYGLRLLYSDFGLPPVVRELAWQFKYIFQYYDRWKEFFADPDMSFEALVKARDWKKLRQLLDDILAYPAQSNESYAAFELVFQMVFKYMDLNFHDTEFDKLIYDYLRRSKPFSRENDPLPKVLANSWFSRNINREKLELLSQSMAEPSLFDNGLSQYVFVGAIESYSSGFQKLHQIHREKNPKKRIEMLRNFRCEMALGELVLHNKK